MKHILLIFIAIVGLFFSSSCILLTPPTKSSSTSVVCIGMENSRKFGKCPGSKIDAERMSKLLSKHSKKVTTLISSQATKGAVVNAIAEALKNDLTIIYYSGHGGSKSQTATTKKNWVEPSGVDSYLCLYDSFMLDDEIWNLFTKAKGRIVFIADCCHSGTMFRVSPSPSMFSASSNSVRLLYIGGCEDTSYSYGSNNGGVMTNTLLKWYSTNYSYETLIRKMKQDTTLKSTENIQIVELGRSFKSLRAFH